MEREEYHGFYALSMNQHATERLSRFLVCVSRSPTAIYIPCCPLTISLSLHSILAQKVKKPVPATHVYIKPFEIYMWFHVDLQPREALEKYWHLHILVDTNGFFFNLIPGYTSWCMEWDYTHKIGKCEQTYSDLVHLLSQDSVIHYLSSSGKITFK